MVGIGLLVIAVGALAQAVLRENSSWPVVIPGLVLVGIGAGLAMASLTSTAMSAVPWQQAGIAAARSAHSGSSATRWHRGLGEVFDSGLTHSAGPGLSAALSGGQAQAVLARTPALAPVVHRAFADGLDFAYVVAGGFGLLAAVLCSPWSARARRRPRPQRRASRGRASPPRPPPRHKRIIPNGGGLPIARPRSQEGRSGQPAHRRSGGA